MASPAPHQDERSRLVCVIDDDVSLLRALRRLLDAGGFQVKTFSSAEDFLESSNSRAPGCLVLDVHLGGLSGFELHEFGHKSRHAVQLSFGIAIFKQDIFTLYVTEIAEPLAECFDQGGIAVRLLRARRENSYQWRFDWLLRLDAARVYLKDKTER